MYHRLLLSFIGAFLYSITLQAQSGQTTNTTKYISTATELAALHNMQMLPSYREGTSVLQVSSYDRTGGNDDGFSGRFSFVRRLPDSSLVLFDERGPGVINRIWTPTPTSDTLDFFIDDSTRPAFSISYIDLFSGTAAPFVAPLSNNQLGGYYCYLPIPFQQRCMIRYRGKQTQFYQIGFRRFPQDTRVQPFRKELDAAAQSAMQQIQNLWQDKNRTVYDFTTNDAAVQVVRQNGVLQPGGRQTLLQLEKGGRIVGFELEPASALEGVVKNLDLKITWDNEKNPAVYAPAADFFGFAFGKQSMQSLLLGTNGKTAYCYFPMPFDRSARVELVYRKSDGTAEPVRFTSRIFYVAAPRKPATEGKFYTRWNHDASVPLLQPHVFLQLTGKGHYVGTVLQSRGLTPGMTGFFEGDDSTVVDGRMTMHGTGSEDYFNGGWYAMMDRWDGAYSLPLSGSLDYNLPLSRTGGYRLFLTDKIPFSKSIYHSIEHGGERNDAPGTYTSVAYFYSNGPAAGAAVPSVATTVVTQPDTMMIYPQLMTMNTIGSMEIKKLWAYNTGGESMIFTPSGESGVRLHLDELPYGDYKVYLDYVQSPHGTSFSVWQRQTPLTRWIASGASDTLRISQQYVADISLGHLNQTLTLRFRPAGNQNQFFLNRIILVRKREE